MCEMAYRSSLPGADDEDVSVRYGYTSFGGGTAASGSGVWWGDWRHAPHASHHPHHVCRTVDRARNFILTHFTPVPPTDLAYSPLPSEDLVMAVTPATVSNSDRLRVPGFRFWFVVLVLIAMIRPGPYGWLGIVQFGLTENAMFSSCSVC